MRRREFVAGLGAQSIAWPSRTYADMSRRANGAGNIPRSYQGQGGNRDNSLASRRSGIATRAAPGVLVKSEY